jgi:thiamine pyrophosphate-dependent acetolactate synthase large subunit-like protein
MKPDFAKFAEATVFYGRRVKRADRLEDAIRDTLAQSGPACST